MPMIVTCPCGRQLQLDELYAVLRGVRDGAISAEHALKRLSRDEKLRLVTGDAAAWERLRRTVARS